ncbi:uncharacterized protein LOC134270389 isoform X2 [Saccostrea cucullata]|uniref:uncharacterized protein LOC134270389 isoform X2 n=1 Tax=Saccostrea cuccullata TaxID=36930 RepID=UPI002ED5E4B2
MADMGQFFLLEHENVESSQETPTDSQESQDSEASISGIDHLSKLAACNKSHLKTLRGSFVSSKKELPEGDGKEERTYHTIRRASKSEYTE